MKVGDLVNWMPNFFDTNRRTRMSPGLILDSSGMVLKKKKFLGPQRKLLKPLEEEKILLLGGFRDK